MILLHFPLQVLLILILQTHPNENHQKRMITIKMEAAFTKISNEQPARRDYVNFCEQPPHPKERKKKTIQRSTTGAAAFQHTESYK